MAAAGIGASDVMAATLAGATHGDRLLWAVAAGAAAKYALSEKLDRLNRGSGLTFCLALRESLHRAAPVVFAAYLTVWCVMVGAALMGGCGLAVEHLTGGAMPRGAGGFLHALAACLIVGLPGGAIWFSRVMRALVVLMLAAMAVCAALTFRPDAGTALGLFVPGAPEGGWVSVLSLLGGIGGTVTLLAYDYERRAHDATHGGASTARETRVDLGAAYVFTALFGMAVLLVAAQVFFRAGIKPEDAKLIPAMAAGLAETLGPAGALTFGVGFWAAVCASMLGVWKTAPAVFGDCLNACRSAPGAAAPACGKPVALALLTLAPAPLPVLGKPVALILAFTILGSVFIPLLAGALLTMDLRLPAGHPAKSGPVSRLVTVATLVLFLVVGGAEILAQLRGR